MAFSSRGQSNSVAPSKAPEAAKNKGTAVQASRYAPKRDGLWQLEEQLSPRFNFEPTEGMGPPDGVPNPLPVAVPNFSSSQSRKARLLEERRKNWAFMTPEELLGTSSLEDLENGSALDKEDPKQSLSILEQYYERREHANKPPRKTANQDRLGVPGARDTAEDSSSSPGADRLGNSRRPDLSGEGALDPHQRLGYGLDPGLFNHSSSISDIFGLGHTEPTPEQLLVHKARMEEFGQILNENWRAPSLDTISGASGNSSSHAAKETSSSVLAGGLQSDDPNAASLGVPSLTGGVTDPFKSLNAPITPGTASALPKAPPVTLTPPTPTFLAPRRQF